MPKELSHVKDTANILSFDDARTMHSRRSSAQSTSTYRPSRGFRPQARRSFDPARAEAEAWGEARAQARRAVEDGGMRSQRRAGSKRDRGFQAQTRAAAARPAFDDAHPDEQDGTQQREGMLASLTRRWDERKRARAKDRADKAFDKQFRSSAPDPSTAGPRAALYKGEMGSSHKRASRMQRTQDADGGKAGFSAVRKAEGGLAALASSRKALTVLVAAACLAVTCFMLYEPAQNYYHAVREHDRLQAELAAVESRNAELEDSVAYLQTESGVEQSARDQLGWVRDGERSVYVQGLEGSGSDQGTSSTAGSVVPGSVEAPATWYSPLLDVIFGAE